MKKYTPLSIVIIVITLVLSGCAGAAVAAIPAASSVTITIGDLVIGFNGIPGDTIPLERVCAEAPEYCPTGKAVLKDEAHAEARHGTGIVQMADDCLNKYGPIKTMVNPSTGRTALTCMDQNGKFIVKVLEKSGDLVTAFLKEKMTSLDQVIKYLENRGYIPQ